MAAATETGQAAASSGKRQRDRRLTASDPRTPGRLAAGPWLLETLTCPERTRGDGTTRSARPPVLPPPPRPPQRRCRHFVSRPGTPRCACAGTASEGPRRGRAAILSVAGSAGFRTPFAFGPNPESTIDLGGRCAGGVRLSVRTRRRGAAPKFAGPDAAAAQLGTEPG
ncbi:uncharacterized protein FLJ40606 [Rhynchocyon petersi]